MNARAAQIIETLGLQPLPMEGGYYVETYRSDEMIPRAVLPERYPADRCCSTLIYFLLTPDVFSAMHRVKSDEVFHFYMGDPVEMLMIRPDGAHEVIAIGTNLDAGERPQVVVTQGVWQGCRLRPGGEFALMGCTVAPGFEFDDYEHGKRAELIDSYPECADMIALLTR